MANYFKKIPDIDYPSLLNDRQGSSDTVRVKNFWRRAKIREDFFGNFVLFTKYNVIGDERPDNVSEKYYGTPNLDWLVLASNNIIDIKNDWPMTEYDLNIYLNEKYSPEQLTKIHHYETIEWRDYNNQLITKGGQVVDESFKVEYLIGGQVKTISPIRSVSFFEWEIQENENKRVIDLVKTEFVDTVLRDFERIMKYDRSSQYINNSLKKTENTRIIG